VKNQVIVITGSSQGIGYALAKACAEKGSKLIISSRNQQSVEIAVKELQEQGLTVKGIACNVSSYEELSKLLDFSVLSFGKIDIWVNNAGVSEGYRNYSELKSQEIDTVIDTNIKGLMYASNVVLKYFEQQGGGYLFNMVGRGFDGKGAKHMSIYNASKAAVASFTKSLAIEYKEKNIYINALMPGMVDTNMIQNTIVSEGLEDDMKAMPMVMKALASPIDEVAVFLADALFEKSIGKTGKIFSILKGWRLVKGIMKISWYGMSGKMK
jgi:glucose 1-dehydrogenase